MRARYLITAVGGDIGSSVIRHLRKEFSRDCLLGCDITPYAGGRTDAGEFFLVPPFTDAAQYTDFLLKECAARAITHILPMTEGEIIVFDQNRKLFEQAGIRLMIQDSKLLQIALSKWETARTVKEIGLKSPRTWRPDDGECISYPVVVKADRGCGSKYVKVAKNRQEYEMALEAVADAVVQEYVGSPDEEYTMGVFSDGTQTRSIAFRRTLCGGMTCTAELVEDEKLDKIAKVTAKNLALKGSINIQMRKHDADYFIFEINPRISGTVGFRHLLGFEDVLWWLKLLDGEKGFLDGVCQEHPPVVGVRTFGETIFRECAVPATSDPLEISARGGVLLLTGNKNALGLCGWLLKRSPVYVYTDRLTIGQVQKLNPSLIISYNYTYLIDKSVIRFMNGNMINLHISYLPWNRGVSPNIWSFIDDTPKGVTIHQISPDFDTGKILYQKQIFFDTGQETFASSYQKLHETITELFQEKWEEIRTLSFSLTEQQTDAGSYHSKKDMQMLQEQVGVDWNEKIADFLKRYASIRKITERGN